jgi:hypothetical protein
VSGDILKQIDAAVDDAREQCCACGCGRELSPDGPSLYYFGPQCQAKAQQAGAHAPEEVLDRADEQHLDLGGIRSWLNLPAHLSFRISPPDVAVLLDHLRGEVLAETTRRDAEDTEDTVGLPEGWLEAAGSAVRPVPADARYSPAEYDDMMRFRRRCEFCMEWAAPVNAVNELVGVHGVQLGAGDRIRQYCGLCGCDFERSVLGLWAYHEDQFVLTAVLGDRYLRRTLTRRRLDRYLRPWRTVLDVWRDLTAELLTEEGCLQSEGARSRPVTGAIDFNMTGDSDREHLLRLMAHINAAQGAWDPVGGYAAPPHVGTSWHSW